METPSQDLLRTREKNREAAARWRARNPGKSAEKMRKWRAENPERAKEHGLAYRERHLTTGTPEEIAAFRAREATSAKQTHQRCKEAVFAAYGGYTCKCCGEQEKSFLSIDHVNNDGAEMKRMGLYSGSGTGFYKWLRKSGYPSGFQVLCMNCQFGKRMNNGVCPHMGKA